MGWGRGRRVFAGVVCTVAWCSATAVADAAPKVEVVSNRADLISGGDALVRVRGVAAEGLTVRAGQRDVSDAFARRSNGLVEGLVSGLPVGRTRLVARGRDGRGAAITITNHPRGGPVFSGAQVQPWNCTTDEHDLGAPADAQCSVPTKTHFVYRSSSPRHIGFQPYDPANPPDDVATTTTDQGREIPFVVRVETGTMNRGIYNVAVLYDPERPWAPWQPQPGWNGKVLWPFGGDCKPWHEQDAPVDATGGWGAPQATLDPPTGAAVDAGVDEALGSIFGNGNAVDALERGFMVANSSMNKYGSTCNSVTSAEAVMMLKEEIAERYGPIRYTIGAGSSGGSMQQYQIASAYPGLLDGIQPMASFPDIWEMVQEAQDCHLLNSYFNQTSPHLWALDPQREAVLGTLVQGGCLTQLDGPQLGTPDVGSYSSTWMNPSNALGCGLPAEEVYSASNRGGVRCTLQDYMVAVFGRRPSDGFANRPFDNTGVQYGLRALESGAILPEQFVDLNEKVGGLSIDWERQPDRSAADAPALDAAYRGGLITHGRELARVPILDIRGQDNVEIHSDFHTYVARARLDRDAGRHDNQVVFTGARPLVGDPRAFNRAFELVDEWLGRIEGDGAPGSLPERVRRNRPAAATDSCWFEGRQVTDQSVCRTLFPYFSDARIAAGGPQTDDVLKCSLRPLRRDDYDVVFTDAQWARLEAAFPGGVCDYERPGVGQGPPLAWPTFAAGPGGRSLGAAPRSRVVR